MIKAHDVSFRIGDKTLVNSVELVVEQGEVFALLGPNGAGKSTLLKLLSGDQHPNEGQITLADRPLADYRSRELALKRAVMSQTAEVTLAFTVQEIVLLGRHPHATDRQTDQKIAIDSLARTECLHLADRLYPTLSGGEQARVTLARVLAQASPLIMLDEPTAALDLRHQQLTMRIAREHAAQDGAVLMVVHDLNLAARYADRVAMMKNGQIVAIGTPREVLTAEIIEMVFEQPVAIVEHPTANCPLIVET